MMILMWFCVMILVLWHMQLSYELEIKPKLEQKNNKSHMDEGAELKFNFVFNLRQS